MVAAKTHYVEPTDDAPRELERRSTPKYYYVTEEEFLDQPESRERIELIDGEVYVAPSATYEHQLVCQEIVYQLELWVRSRTTLRPALCFAPCDIRFGQDRILQPDLFVVLAGLPRKAEMPLTVTPDLCVEVLSQDRTRDRVTKRTIYAEAGVRELWTVDLRGFVERWSGPHLTTRTAHTDRLTTPLLPEFELDITALFADPG